MAFGYCYTQSNWGCSSISENQTKPNQKNLLPSLQPRHWSNNLYVGLRSRPHPSLDWWTLVFVLRLPPPPWLLSKVTFVGTKKTSQGRWSFSKSFLVCEVTLSTGPSAPEGMDWVCFCSTAYLHCPQYIFVEEFSKNEYITNDSPVQHRLR